MSLADVEREWAAMQDKQRQALLTYLAFLTAMEISANQNSSSGPNSNNVDKNGGGNSSKVKFGSNTKSSNKLNNQMNSRGWTKESVKDTIDNPYTTRKSINLATKNSATVYYTKQGSYVIVDDVSNEIVQVSNNINPSAWNPDSNIMNPYKPK